MSTSRIVHHRLPQPAPARVLASGAHLKNTACLVDGHNLWLSPVHGDLSGPEACAALDESVALLVAQADGPIDAIAHDLHPDFHSTRVAAEWGQRLRVRNLAVQHHHAHIAAVCAEHGIDGPVLGFAADGSGLGSDGLPWGGELLRVDGADFTRLGHLAPLALPGGDRAALEPWRMAAAALHALGRGGEIVPRWSAAVGEPAARTIAAMLERDVRCPLTSSAGRWFDAAAAALGLCLHQSHEAEAAIARERYDAVVLTADKTGRARVCIRRDGASLEGAAEDIDEAHLAQLLALLALAVVNQLTRVVDDARVLLDVLRREDAPALDAGPALRDLRKWRLLLCHVSSGAAASWRDVRQAPASLRSPHRPARRLRPARASTTPP